MVKPSPAKFFREVRQEARQVTWPTAKETRISTVMILVIAGIAALFFLLVDMLAGSAVQWVLGIGG